MVAWSRDASSIAIISIAFVALAACQTPDSGKPAAQDVTNGDSAHGEADVAAPDTVDTDTAEVQERPCVDFAGIYRVDSTCTERESGTWSLVCVDQNVCDGATWFHTGLRTELLMDMQGWTGTPASARNGCAGTATEAGFSFACEDDVGNYAGLCTGEATRVAIPGATRYCCSVAAQDCGDGLRCAVITGTETTNSATACVPVGAGLAEGAECVESSLPDADNCDNGLACTDLGREGGTPICQRLCGESSHCAAGETCVWDGDHRVAKADVGICKQSCDPLAPSCPDGSTCQSTFGSSSPNFREEGQYRTAWCGLAGAGAKGDACNFGPAECQSDLYCAFHPAYAPPLRCVSPCLNDGDCDAEESCIDVSNTPDPEVPGLDAARYCFPKRS